MKKLRLAGPFLVLFFSRYSSYAGDPTSKPLHMVAKKLALTVEISNRPSGLGDQLQQMSMSADKQIVTDALTRNDFLFVFEHIENNLEYNLALSKKLWELVREDLKSKVLQALTGGNIRWVLDRCYELPGNQDDFYKELLIETDAVVDRSNECGILGSDQAEKFHQEIADLLGETDSDTEPLAKRLRVDWLSLESAKWEKEVNRAVDSNDFLYAFDMIENNLKKGGKLYNKLSNKIKKTFNARVKEAIKQGKVEYASQLIDQLPESAEALRDKLNTRLAMRVSMREAKKETLGQPVRRPKIEGQSKEERKAQEVRALCKNSEIGRMAEKAESIFESIKATYTLLTDSVKKRKLIDGMIKKEGDNVISHEELLKEVVDEAFQKADFLQVLRDGITSEIGQVRDAAKLANTDRSRDAFLSAQSSVERINELCDKAEKYAKILLTTSV